METETPTPPQHEPESETTGTEVQQPDTKQADPLLSAEVKEREHHFHPTAKVEPVEEATNLDVFFPDDDDDLALTPSPQLDTQGEEQVPSPDLDPMEVSAQGAAPTPTETPANSLSTSASEFGWEVIQKTLPDMVHEVARMEKREVDKILSQIDKRCGKEETEVIEEINSEFRKGLELSSSHNQMGKAAMKQLFVSKGIEKKITPELMLGIVLLLILVSWGLAYKRFSRQKRDLFDRLEHLVQTQLKATEDKKPTSDKTTKE